ncbi:MAG: T9SS type A sorting domain-containing protein [Ignavibacteriae bacterium]|nr:T9SS type A sorting domain-containing protein [Ignavibacteriota bacterium]
MHIELITKLKYPNPFQPIGIEYELPEEASVTLTIVDLENDRVTTLFSQQLMKAGTHLTQFNLHELPSGNYAYRLVAEGKSQTLTETKKIR